MSVQKKQFEVWSIISVGLFLLFVFFLIYPLFGVMKQAVIDKDGGFTFKQFVKFFSQKYYTNTISNSVKVTLAVTFFSLLVGIPMSYFYSFYNLKLSKLIFTISILCCMSAPFLGAYSWILLLGRSGVITTFFRDNLGINIPNIYGFGGILLVQTLKFFPLVFIYMNGAFKNIDNTLMEASANMGCTGVRRLFSVVLSLVMPTVLAASLLVFMRAFADFGTPVVIGEGYMTFPVLIYREFVNENGADYGFASAISVIAMIVTALVFFAQKWASRKFSYSMNSLHPVEKKEAKGISGFLIHLYCYAVVIIAFLPQLYIIYLSFRKTNQSGTLFVKGFSLGSYKAAMDRLLVRSINNTVMLGVLALLFIIVIAILIAYLTVRRKNILNDTIDTFAMIPYIMPGVVIGIALLTAFGRKPFKLTGTFTIMLLAVIIRRLPYTIRSATATLSQISISIEEAALSLGASKIKTFTRITVPMMSNGIMSGAILSWVAILTEVSSAIILYNNKSITMTISAYVAITRGNEGMAAAFAAILTVMTIISLLVYLKVTKSEDIRL
jgi:iron(III) transport system permease protein